MPYCHPSSSVSMSRTKFHSSSEDHIGSICMGGTSPSKSASERFGGSKGCLYFKPPSIHLYFCSLSIGRNGRHQELALPKGTRARSTSQTMHLHVVFADSSLSRACVRACERAVRIFAVQSPLF